MRPATVSKVSTPRAMHMRFSEPRALIRSGMLCPLTFLKKQRRAAPLDGPVGNLGDFENRIDLGGDPLELARRFKRGDEFCCAVVCHVRIAPRL